VHLSDSPRATLAIWLAAAFLAAFALLHLIGSRGSGDAGSAVRIDRRVAPTGGAASTAGAPSAADRGATIYVHVAGAVRRSGLLRVPSGSRIAMAVEQAGGPTRRADLSGVNLAAKVEDGQQILVPVRGAVPSLGGVAGSAVPGTVGAAAGPKPSLGTATLEQLDQIDGIGPTLAQRIVEYRTEHGGFHSIGELREVEGIGEKRFETLREALQP
jgi:competence protein ComEA